MTEKEKKEICNKCDISYVCDHKSMPDCDDIKEKEIEEMQNEIEYQLSSCNKYNGINDCETCELLNDKCQCTLSGMLSKSLYNAGYGKVEDYKKEIERLKNENDKLCQGIYFGTGEQFCEKLKEIKQQEIKEFAEKLKDKFNGYEATSYNGYEEGWHDLQEEIDDLVKECGVEL